MSIGFKPIEFCELVLLDTFRRWEEMEYGTNSLLRQFWTSDCGSCDFSSAWIIYLYLFYPWLFQVLKGSKPNCHFHVKVYQISIDFSKLCILVEQRTHLCQIPEDVGLHLGVEEKGIKVQAWCCFLKRVVRCSHWNRGLNVTLSFLYPPSGSRVNVLYLNIPSEVLYLEDCKCHLRKLSRCHKLINKTPVNKKDLIWMQCPPLLAIGPSSVV